MQRKSKRCSERSLSSRPAYDRPAQSSSHQKNIVSLRSSVDFHKLNAVIVNNSYPLPRKDECIYFHRDLHSFSELDVSAGYWEIKINEYDRSEKAFRSHPALSNCANVLWREKHTVDILANGGRHIIVT